MEILLSYTQMLESWNPLGLTVPNKKPRNKTIVDGILNAAEYSGVDTTGLHTLLKAMSPRMSKVDNAQVSFYENSVKCVADNLTRTTPARFLRRIIPTVSNTMAEAFALFWKNNVSHNPKDYVLYVGNTRKDFKQSFVNVRKNVGIYFTSGVKSISDSCMRHSFDNLVCHPSEVYASGDFEVVIIKDLRGKTRARCVVRIKDYHNNPVYYPNYIYSSDDHSTKMIIDHFKTKENIIFLYNRENLWDGAKLLSINVQDSSNLFVCPFVDVVRYVMRHEDKTHLVVTTNEDGVLNNTGGYVKITKAAYIYYKEE